MGPEVITVADDTYSFEKWSKTGSKTGSFLNSTFESTNEDDQAKFALNFCDSPARTSIESSDDEIGADSEIDENDISLRSLGLDFV